MLNGLGIGPRIGAIAIVQQTDGPLMLTGFEAVFPFINVPAIAEETMIEAQAVGDKRHGGAGVTDGPVLEVQFMNPAQV